MQDLTDTSAKPAGNASDCARPNRKSKIENRKCLRGFDLTFLAPLFLVGLATTAIPVVIHLINRRRTRQIPFSTLMFLRMAHQRTARRRRLRELVMLALRCAILALLALAFADPHYSGALLGGTGAAAGERPCAVLVVDDSFSMGYRHGGKTSFDHACEAARAIIASLPPGSEAVLLFTCGNSEWEIPTPTPNLLQLEQSIRSARLTARAGPLVPALMRADALMAEEQDRAFEVYVLTDLQKRAWSAGESADAPGVLASQGAFTVVVDCGAQTPDNLALGALAAKGEGRRDTLAFTATVRNFGRSAREVKLALRTGRDASGAAAELRAAKSVSVPGGGASQVALEETLEEGGAHAGRVSIPADALPLDDVRYFAVDASTQADVLLVGEGDARRPGSDLFYVHTALSLGSSPFDTFAVSPGELATMHLGDVRVIVAGPIRGLSSGTARALRDFVDRGGGLVLFLGPDAAASEYNQLLGPPEAASPEQDGRALLPGTLGDVQQSADEARLTWEQIDFAHPIFELFAGLRAKEMGFIRTRGYVAVTLDDVEGSRARVLARYSDGGAAIMEGALGAGRVLVFTTSCDGAWSNLPLRASFVPILHRTVAYLAETRTTPIDEHRVGQPFEFAFPAEAGPVSLEVVSPDGEQHVVVSEVEGDRNALVFKDTHAPGIYELKPSRPGGRIPSLCAVNVDTAESDLARISERQLGAVLPEARLRVAGEVTAHGMGIRDEQGGTRFWGTLIVLLVGASLVESVLASLFSPRRGPEAVRARSVDFAGARGGEGGRA